MFETIVTILIFIAVIAVTAVLFGGWLIVTIVSLIGRLLLAPFRRGARTAPSPPPPHMAMLEGSATTTARCANGLCLAENAATASFCRRCGAPLRPAQPVPVRRVAMW